MKIVLSNDSEFMFIIKLIDKVKSDDFISNLVISKYQRSLRNVVRTTYGERFLGLSNGGDTIPYVCIMMNYISDLVSIKKNDKQLFMNNISIIEKTAKEFEMAYRRWYHDN